MGSGAFAAVFRAGRRGNERGRLRLVKRGDLEIDVERDEQGKPTRMLIGFSEQSQHERLFDCQVRALKLPQPVYEFRFMPPRRFRFDFAWPDNKVAVEVEGGIWNGGRHVRGNGYENDCKKYSEAAILGWKVIRATGKMIKDGTAIELLKRALNNELSMKQGVIKVK
jgi:very-short-patch-repair endonuclease